MLFYKDVFSADNDHIVSIKEQVYLMKRFVCNNNAIFVGSFD